jgi:hypothetical protein
MFSTVFHNLKDPHLIPTIKTDLKTKNIYHYNNKAGVEQTLKALHISSTPQGTIPNVTYIN